MAIYHLEAKVVSRGAGRSAVAASAYLSCSNILNVYDGVRHDFTREKGLVWEQVFLPDYAPTEWQDRSILWNAVEESEKTKDSRLAREFIVALPIELDKCQWQALLTEFIREQFVSDGMCADVAIHDTDGHNPHSHIMLTVRPLDEQGNWQYKTEKEYLCVRNGEERGFTAAEFKAVQTDGWEKQYPYKVGRKKVYMTPSEAEKHGYERADKHPKSTKFGRQNPITERWNSEEQLVQWRKAWADVANRYLERYGHEERIDHRSHADRGLTEQPTIHEGVVARILEKKGIVSDRCEINRQIKADNRLLRELRSAYEKLLKAVKNTIPTIAEALESLREKMIIIRYRFRSLRIEKYQFIKRVDNLKPELQRYTQLAEQIMDKTQKRKTLLKEKKETPIYKIGSLRDLSRRITQLTEELEELKTEKEFLLRKLNCAEEGDLSGVRKNVAAMERSMKKLEQQEAKYAAELDKTLQEYKKVKEQSTDLDSFELMKTRLAIRPERERTMIQSVKSDFWPEYDSLLLYDCGSDIDNLLDEFEEERSTRERIYREQREQAQQSRKKTKTYGQEL